MDIADFRPEPGARVAVLTGAGISVAAGLPTYRGPGGLWEENPELEANASALLGGTDPDFLWGTWGPWRAEINAAEPTVAHKVLAAFQQHTFTEGGSLTIITQNIDGLHGRAGAEKVMELHGNVNMTRCSQWKTPGKGCKREPWVDTDPTGGTRTCPDCGAFTRPNIVLFHENLNAKVMNNAEWAVRTCDLFVAIGTSLEVYPAAGLVPTIPRKTPRLNISVRPAKKAWFTEVFDVTADEGCEALLGL